MLINYKYDKDHDYIVKSEIAQNENQLDNNRKVVIYDRPLLNVLREAILTDRSDYSALSGINPILKRNNAKKAVDSKYKLMKYELMTIYQNLLAEQTKQQDYDFESINMAKAKKEEDLVQNSKEDDLFKLVEDNNSDLDEIEKRIKKENEEKQESKRKKTLQRELEWVKMTPKARQAKGKARLSSYERMMNEDVREKEEKLEIFIPNGPRLGDRVLDAKGITKAYGEKILFENLTFSLPVAGIVGVIGANGAGKTTLFRMIMGLEKPDSGTFEVGPTVKIGYIDQQHSEIDPQKTVWETISGGNEQISLGGRLVNSRAYVSRFNFSGTDQNKKTEILSGGERNRMHLAMTLKSEANVLLLDEPTNDIDVNTLRALEEGLENFAGCAVVISHDRWFLDRIATHILAFEGDSQVYFFEGSYSEYEENKKKRLGDTTPKRMKYKKLIVS